MDERTIIATLQERGEHSEQAWREFLTRYSNLILKILWQFDRDHDRVMEAYVAVCSRLAAEDFGLLRRFRDDSRLRDSDFPQWLSVVVRNLCLDRYRAETGRKRMPKALQRLTQAEQAVFKLYYWGGYSADEIRHHLGDRSNNHRGDVASVLEGIHRRLHRPPRRTLPPAVIIPFDDARHHVSPEEPVDWLDDVETWLATLPREQRLIVRLRFWEDMSSAEIARVLHIRPSRRVYTILEGALRTLRKKAGRRRQEA